MSGAEPNAAAAPRKLVRLAVILGVLGLGLAAAAWNQVAESNALASGGVRVEAQVVAVDQYDRRGVMSYVPTFMFRTADGRVVRQKSSETLSSNAEIGGGRPVTVVYDPKDITRLRLASSVDGGIGGLAWVLGGLAVLSFGMAGYVMVGKPAARG